MSARLNIARRFRRSAQLDHDVWAPDALVGYVISPLGRDVALRLCTEAATEGGGRAFSIIGPYGTGKSSFLTFLLRLWRWDADAIDRLRSSSYPEADTIASAVDSLGGALVPVVVTGERGPLAPAILRAVARAAERVWSGRGRPPDVIRLRLPGLLDRFEAGEDVPDHEVAELVADAAEKFCRGPGTQGEGVPQAGFVLVIDEMGKHSEWAALHTDRADLYLLQLLAERAARIAPARLMVLTVLHQELAAYAENLARSLREDWAKIAGRFETIPYVESPRHAVALISGAMMLSERDRAGPAYELAADHAEQLAGRVAASMADAPLLRCFPLHPLTALCLGPLFRRRVAQNERSLFAFLGSHEPFGLQDWLARADLTSPHAGLYRLDHLFDYVLANIGVRGASEPGDRSWAVAEAALARMPHDAGEPEARLLKAVALLTLLGPSIGLKSDAENLELATQLTPSTCESSLARLAKASILVYRRFKAAWQLWDGSDLDVSALVARCRFKVEAQGGLAEAANRLLPPAPVVATRLAHETGTLRILRVAYVADTSSPVDFGGADGLLLRVLPDRIEDLPEMVARLGMASLVPPVVPVVHAVPADASHVHETLLEYLAICTALEGTPELAADPVARRDLEERRVAMYDVLSSLLRATYEVRWHHRGEIFAVGGRPSRVASTILRSAFADAPVIRNELVNRATLSSAAAAARRTLMERMLTHAAQPLLGIEGFPPEMSLYRSVLEVTRLHRPVQSTSPDGAWNFADPQPASPVEAVWQRIGAVLKRGGASRTRFDVLTAALERPPFGVRAGVSPILVLAWLVAHADEVFWYEQNSFVVAPGPDLVHRLLRRQADFDVQHAAPNGVLGVLADALRRRGVQGLTSEHRDAPLRLVRGLVRLVSGLSPYAASTHRVSPTARRVRAAIKGARDPMRLLLESLPEALGLAPAREGSLDEARAEEIAIALTAALHELSVADGALQDELEAILAELMGASGPGPTFRRELASRAVTLSAARVDLPPFAGRLVALAVGLDDAPNDPGSRSLFLDGVGTAILGKAPSHWTDSDLDRFRLAAVEPCRSVLAAERFALELGRADEAPIRMVRVSLLDNRGERQDAVGVLRPEEVDAALAFEAEIVEIANRRGISTPGLVYAVLSTMMARINGTPV